MVDSLAVVSNTVDTSLVGSAVNQLINGNYVIAIIIFIGFGIAIFFNKAINDSVFRKDLGNLRIFKKSKDIKLNAHKLFSYGAIAASYADRITLSSSLKNNIFKTILDIKVQTVIRKAKEYLKLFNKGEYDKEILIQELSSLTSNMLEGYEKHIKEALVIKYNEDAEFLFDYIYRRGFEPYHSKNVTYILRVIDRFEDSILSDEQKVYMYFSLLYVALDLAILDCERVFRDMNGSLKTYEEKYK